MFQGAGRTIGKATPCFCYSIIPPGRTARFYFKARQVRSPSEGSCCCTAHTQGCAWGLVWEQAAALQAGHHPGPAVGDTGSLVAM